MCTKHSCFFVLARMRARRYGSKSLQRRVEIVKKYSSFGWSQNGKRIAGYLLLYYNTQGLGIGLFFWVWGCANCIVFWLHNLLCLLAERCWCVMHVHTGDARCCRKRCVFQHITQFDITLGDELNYIHITISFRVGLYRVIFVVKPSIAH
jgi:hypothetical protein